MGESGPLEHFKIPQHGNPVLQDHFYPFFSHLLFSVHQEVHSKLGDVDAVEVICSECSIAFGALPLASVIASLQAFIAEDVETLGEDSLLISCITTGTSQFSLEWRQQSGQAQIIYTYKATQPVKSLNV